MRTQSFYILHLDELEHFYDGGIQKIVTTVVPHKSVHDRREQISFDYVSKMRANRHKTPFFCYHPPSPVIKLVLERYEFPHEPQGAEDEEFVRGLHEHQYPA